MIRVDVKGEMLRWARKRSGLELEDLAHKFPKLTDWEAGEVQPTLKQLESFAKATYTPVGYFFLPRPPEERIPIPDCRTIRNQEIARPSPNLLEMIYICQQRQGWYRQYAKSAGFKPLPFIGSVKLGSDIASTAALIGDALGFDLEERHRCRTWSEALRCFIEQAEALGILVMCSGVVMNNNRRRLDPEEFRGFAMADDLAPLVFINGSDTKAAQMFTLAHELVHLWLGESALTDAGLEMKSNMEIERWCNQVAAELLVPRESLQAVIDEGQDIEQQIGPLARRFKVSTLVVLRRLHDTEYLSSTEFHEKFAAELKRLLSMKKGGGGNFYLTQASRVSKRFARALVQHTMEGQTLYRDAMRMVGISKVETFHQLGQSLNPSP